MPLSFRSKHHGNIAFGFFNIESDMLLMEKYFFFADRFCEWMVELADQGENENKDITCPVFYIADSNDIGDLMGAIHGMRFTGFMGTIYRRFPFPEDSVDFKQNPEGVQTQKIVIKEIEPFARKKEISMGLSNEGQFHFGSYLFDMEVFHELIRYVWQGGYPLWKDMVRPPYVLQMKKKIVKSTNAFFKGVFS